MTNRNQRKLIATLPKLKDVITRLTEIMEEEAEYVENEDFGLSPDEIDNTVDNVNALDEHIGTLKDVEKSITEYFRFE